MSIASELTTAGIAAMKAGDVANARTVLTAAVRADSEDATAWLWCSAAVTAIEEKRYCLQQVLRIIPASPAAHKGMAQIGEGAVTSPLGVEAPMMVAATPVQVVAAAVAQPPQIIEMYVPPPPKQVAKPLGCGGAVALLVILLFVGFGVLTVLGKPVNGGGRSESSGGADRIGAFLICQDFVKARLKAPSTAVFPSRNDATTSISELGSGRYQIDSHVDSQNGFGAMIRMEYACHVQYTHSSGGDDYYNLEKMTTSED